LEEEMMERFASAYGRVLFPRRYRSRSDAPAHDASTGGEPSGALAPDALEVSMSAAIYRAVLGVERLLESLRQRSVRRGAPARPQAAPIGCG
jgi:hypothetical protein